MRPELDDLPRMGNEPPHLIRDISASERTRWIGVWIPRGDISLVQHRRPIYEFLCNLMLWLFSVLKKGGRISPALAPEGPTTVCTFFSKV
jgi:hypothetical protein